MTKIKEIIQFLEKTAPPSLQEAYDNSGLLTGDPEDEVTGVLITLDCIEEVVEEAIDNNCNLIIAHHPIIFKGLKSLTGKNYVERTVIRAIRNQISIYAIHTNLDNVINGVNAKLASIIGLEDLRILSPKLNNLSKLVTFVPVKDTKMVLNGLSEAGAGNIGDYSACSFRVEGKGTFLPGEHTNPTIGEANKLEEVREDRIEVILPNHLKNRIIEQLKAIHPYEEVAYYLSDLDNENQETGSGMIGKLDQSMTPLEFLAHLKKKMDLKMIKYTKGFNGPVRRVAICGGSGSFLLQSALMQRADAFVTSDFKYHEYFDAEDRLMIADVGHYESEVFTKDLIYDLLNKNFANFALHLSKVVTNPVGYF